jgi:hypothetical protein
LLGTLDGVFSPSFLQMASKILKVLVVDGGCQGLVEKIVQCAAANPRLSARTLDVQQPAIADLAPGGAAHEALQTAEIIVGSPGDMVNLIEHAKNVSADCGPGKRLRAPACSPRCAPIAACVQQRARPPGPNDA